MWMQTGQGIWGLGLSKRRGDDVLTLAREQIHKYHIPHMYKPFGIKSYMKDHRHKCLWGHLDYFSATV